MMSDGKDSLAGLLGDVERLGTERYVSRCCTYFGRRDVDGGICHGCPAFSYNDCTRAVFCDLASRLSCLRYLVLGLDPADNCELKKIQNMIKEGEL